MSGIIKIHGKNYKTVSLRVSEFRENEKYAGYSIQTEVINNDSNNVTMKCCILNIDNNVVATGFAEETRGSSMINKTSALENCETSCIGRALACLGLAGEEYASANEVSEAIIEQEKTKVIDYFKKYNSAVINNFSSINFIKESIKSNDLSSASEAWYEMSEEDQHSIYGLAPTKGGVLTTEEREIMKTTEWREASNH